MSPRHRQGGFTIIELVVVITIAALAVGGIALSLGATAQVKLRSSCWTLISAVRYAYSHAVTRGVTARVVIDFEGRSFHIEETEGRVVLGRDGETDEEPEQGGAGGGGGGARGADAGVGGGSASFADVGGMPGQAPGMSMGIGMLMGMGGSGATPADFMSGFTPGALTDPFLLSMSRGDSEGGAGYRRPAFKRLDGRRGESRELEGDTAFVKAFTPHEPKARMEGKAYVYFFPGGVTEHSIIQLSDGDERIYSVEIHPLTGRSVIHRTALEPEEDLDELQEAEE